MYNSIRFVFGSGMCAGIDILVAGCWLLVAGCWLLVAGCWLLVAGCWLLVAGCWSLASVLKYITKFYINDLTPM
jgi:hypothetical protein